MIGYFFRLTCVCVSAFFLLHLLLGLLVLAGSSPAVRLAARLRPRSGARLLFCVRLSPLALSLLTVLGLCIPSYLRFERDAAEEIGLRCLVLALAGMVLIAISSIRLVQALTTRTDRRPLMALVGIFRPRLIIARKVREALSDGQMEAALLHEEAHRRAYDNLKRLTLFLAPGVLPFHRSFAALERHWACLTEWAADDDAAAGEPLRAFALAEALVRVARLSTFVESSPAISELVASHSDLGQRIQRLLAPAPAASGSRPRSPRRSLTRTVRPWSFVAAGLGMLVLASRQPNLLFLVHGALERLVH